MTDSIAQKVAVSFARRYYTTLVEQPTELASFYAPSATVRHLSQPSIKATGAPLQTLLTSTSFGSLGSVTRVELKSVSVAGTTSGNIAVSVSGALHATGPGAGSTQSGQSFAQEFELREIASKTYAIVADTLSFVATGPAAGQGQAWALDTPPMFAQKPAADKADMTELHQPPTTAAVPPPAAGTVAVAPEPVAAEKEAAAPVETTPTASPQPAPAAKAPQSFAEALRAKRAAGPEDAKKAAAPVRVTDKAAAPEKPKEEKKKGKAPAREPGAAKPKAERPERSEARKAPANGAEAKKRPAHATGAANSSSAPVIFYDVIIKNLPEGSSEQDVRAMLPADITVSLVKVESKASRTDPTDKRTFAFVQLDAAALKTAGAEKKDAIAKVVSEGNAKGEAQKITFEEVRERRKFTEGTRAPRQSAKRSAPAAAAPAAEKA